MHLQVAAKPASWWPHPHISPQQERKFAVRKAGYKISLLTHPRLGRIQSGEALIDYKQKTEAANTDLATKYPACAPMSLASPAPRCRLVPANFSSQDRSSYFWNETFVADSL
jgi:hypothetical protein